MDESCGLTDGFTYGTEECDHIVVGFLLDLEHALDTTRSTADSFHGIGGDTPTSVPGFANRDFHGQPLLDLMILRPDRSHFWACISLDHVLLRIGVMIRPHAHKGPFDLSRQVYVHLTPLQCKPGRLYY